MLLVAALATACTDGHSPPSAAPPSTLAPVTIAPTASPTSSPSPSPSEPLTTGPNVRPGEKPPEYPQLAKRHTANGAITFAAYFYRAFDWGYATNDPYLVAQVSEPSCSACRRYVRGIEGVRHRVNAALLGGRVRVHAVSIFHGVLDIPSDYAVDVAFSEGAVVLRDGTGRRTTLAAAVANFHSLLFVSWRQGGWAVVEVTDKK